MSDSKRPGERISMRGYRMDEVVSALQKAIRRGDEPQAIWWAAEGDQSGFGDWVFVRLQVIASEDVGLAWLEGPAVIRALHEAYREAKKRRGLTHRLFLVHAAAVLARARVSRRLDDALWWAYGAPFRRFEIPDEALDSHTARGRSMGRGDEHWLAEASRLVNELDLGPKPYFDAIWGEHADVQTRWFELQYRGWDDDAPRPPLEPPLEQPTDDDQPRLDLDG